jgi:hypothetical protein
MGSLVDSLSLPLKVGWIVWMAWMVSQAIWYLRATTTVMNAEAVVNDPQPQRRSRQPMVNLAFVRQRKVKKQRVPDGPLSITRLPEDFPAY